MSDVTWPPTEAQMERVGDMPIAYCAECARDFDGEIAECVHATSTCDLREMDPPLDTAADLYGDEGEAW